MFEFDYPDGTEILDQSDPHENKLAIVWKGKVVPVEFGRPYAESLERVKQGRGATQEKGK